MSAPGLSNEARQAVNAAFDAMSNWRIETPKNNEKNIEQVIEKMAAAAQALGWPAEIVEATRSQMQSITRMQIQAMDHMMDAWEEQIKASNQMGGSPSAILSKLKSSAVRPSRQLAEDRHFPNRGDEPFAVLDAIRGAVAESLGRRDGVLGQGWQV